VLCATCGKPRSADAHLEDDQAARAQRVELVGVAAGCAGGDEERVELRLVARVEGRHERSEERLRGDRGAGTAERAAATTIAAARPPILLDYTNGGVPVPARPFSCQLDITPVPVHASAEET